MDRVFSAYLYATSHHFGVPSISCKLVSILGSIGLSTYQKSKTTFRTLNVAIHFRTDDPALEEEDEMLAVGKATYAAVWANFALCSNYVRGRARPNIPCERRLTSEDVQPRNGQSYHPRRGGACL